MGPFSNNQRFDTWTRGAIPLLLTLVVVIFNIIPLRLPDYSQMAPDLVLMAIYYWTVHRPDLMRPWSVFVIGVIDDVLSGTPLGVTALVLLFAHWAIVSQHKVFRGQSFALLWCGFALVASGAKILMLLLAFANGYGLEDPSRLVMQYALTVALYPIIALLMGRAQRALLPAV
jgi:rod shape-determining protein MreD